MLEGYKHWYKSKRLGKHVITDDLLFPVGITESADTLYDCLYSIEACCVFFSVGTIFATINTWIVEY